MDNQTNGTEQKAQKKTQTYVECDIWQQQYFTQWENMGYSKNGPRTVCYSSGKIFQNQIDTAYHNTDVNIKRKILYILE